MIPKKHKICERINDVSGQSVAYITTDGNKYYFWHGDNKPVKGNSPLAFNKPKGDLR